MADSVALLLSVAPTLTPDDMRGILTSTASHMPGFSEFEAGAGYINVYAAIDKAFHRTKNYGSYGGPVGSAEILSANYSQHGRAAAVPYRLLTGGAARTRQCELYDVYG